MKPYTTKLRCFYFWRLETGSAGDFTHSLPGSCAIKFNMAGNVQFLDLTPSRQEARRHLVNACFNPCDLIGFERTMRDSVKNLLLIVYRLW